MNSSNKLACWGRKSILQMRTWCIRIRFDLKKMKPNILRPNTAVISWKNLQSGKNLSVSAYSLCFFIFALTKALRWSICSTIRFVLMMIHLKLILREFLGSAELSKAQTLCILKQHRLRLVRIKFSYLQFSK